MSTISQLEVWKRHPVHTNYEISSLGNVRNAWRGNFISRVPGKRMFVHVWKRGAVTTARLVWETFVGPIPDWADVDHIDEDKTNDSLENLQLLTREQNQAKHWA